MADIARFPRVTSSDRPRPGPPEPLWRQLLGDQLRRRRHQRHEILSATAEKAGVSPQYLSEVERGLKEPSSEMIAAIAGALDTNLVDLTSAIADELRSGAVSASVSVSVTRGSLALAA